jgi:hypothetical protein
VAFVWNWWGALGLIGLPLALAMAAVVYFAAPGRSVNRRLALVLFFEGVTVTVCAAGLDTFLTSPVDYFATQGVHATAVIAIPFLYLIFLGAALDTPLVRPLKHKLAVPALVGIMLLLEALRFAYPRQFVAGLDQPWYATWAVVDGPWFVLATQFWGVVSLFGLAAGLDAWRRSKTDIARRRAKAYVMAFGLRDIYWTLVLFVILPHMNPYHDVLWGIVFTQGMSLGHIVFVSVLGYGILKTQLFDIDLRVKWTVKQSTVAASFVGVFFVVSESAQSLFSVQFGPVMGMVAAGALVFAISPLQRLGERVSSAALPGVSDSPEYLSYRKLQVYRATLEGAWADGEVTAKERTMLDRLRRELGIQAQDADAVEREVQSILAPAAVPG